MILKKNNNKGNNMTGKILTCDNQSTLIKFIETPSKNSYQTDKVIRLGLYPLSSPSDFAMDSIHSLTFGRTKTVSLADARHVAHLISEHIHAPVAVIKELAVSRIEKKRVLEVDPITHEERLKPGIEEEDVYVPTALEFTNVEHFRTVIEFLNQNEYLSTADRAALNPYIKEIEDAVYFNQNLTETASPMQQEVLRFIAEPYVDAIVDLCAQLDNPAAFLGETTWATLQEPLSRQDIARAALYGSCQNGSRMLFLELFSGLKEELDSGEALKKIYFGDSTLESTFIRQGAGVPCLEAQREVLAELIEEKLSEKFGPEQTEALPDGTDPLLVRTLRHRLFCDGYSLDMTSQDFSQRPVQIRMNPFGSTIEALNGNFGSQEDFGFISLHNWSTPDGMKIEGEAAKTRFNQIRSEVEAALPGQEIES